MTLRKRENMGHITSKEAYKNLEERINWFTQGAPASQTLYKILEVLYSEKKQNGYRCCRYGLLRLKKRHRSGVRQN